MKINSLLLLASLAVLATNASAADRQTQTDVVVLPICVVSAPRYQPAEEKVNASLNELRQQAHATAGIAAQLPVLKALAVQPNVLERAAQDARAVHVAKL